MSQEKIDLLILTEGGTQSGFGHLTRTYAVARAYQKEFPRSRVSFLIHGDKAALRYNQKLGLDCRMTEWFGRKILETLEMAGRAHAILIDSYLAPKFFCGRLAGINPNIVWLDDYARLDYPAGKVVVPAAYRPRGLMRLKRKCRVFFGRDYVILRNAFGNASAVLEPRGALKNVLLLLGGTGTLKHVKQIMSAIPEFEDLNFVWVAPHAKHAKVPPNLKIKSGLDDRQMLGLMKRADAAISAGGQTLYELARAGLPAIVFRIAENQRQNIDFFESNGSVLYAGKFGAHSMPKLAHCWEKIMVRSTRQKMSKRAVRVTDGCGAFRIARLLQGSNK